MNQILRIHQSRFWIGILVTIGVLLSSIALPATAERTPKHYTELEFPPLPEIQLPDYTRFELNNGMVVYLVEDRELPLVSGTAIVRTGSRLEPGDKVGLASLTGTVMRTGGTKKHTGDELNQILEQRAASVETSIGQTSGSGGFSALSEDVDRVLGLFAEVLREPVFAPEKLEVAKTRFAGNIARRNDDPGDIASREFFKLIYGAQSPYARISEYQTLENITREDLVAFHQRYFHPNNTILGVVGDFDTAAMKALVEKHFGNWRKQSNLEPIELPPVEQAQQGGVFFIDQPQLTQSYIQVGHLGGQRDNPDHPALGVLNGVLNGFGGRLFNEIRSRQGLAYSVYAAWSARYDYPGVFISGGQTRSDATVPFLRSIQREIERIRNQPITPEELQYAQESTINSFVFNFTDPAQTLSRLMRYEYYGYPEDFIFKYQQGVASTTIEDVQRVAQKYLKPENLVILVVGNSDAIQPSLSNLDPALEVTSIDITIPEPAQI
ncbi:MAG: pitrilysin family protein [Cyanobacteriota bacterium]|nr:pitrilysin family protein [Cyanobacteriota bacterium]